MRVIDLNHQAREEWRSGVLTRMRTSALNGAGQLCIFEQWCETGHGAPTHLHAVEEVLRVLDGEADVWIGDEHAKVTSLARYATVPVINGLTDDSHPCQAMADLMTLEEHFGPGSLSGKTLAFIGDGNNVATSLVQAGVMLGVNINLASPSGYELPDAIIQQASRVARHGAQIRLFRDPIEAVSGVQAVYTDVWTSMGQESEAAHRRKAFAGYQVTSQLMRHAAPGASFMHCLPAHREEEVSTEVMESSASVVFDQAENRLHAQKALLYTLMTDRAPRT